MKTLLICLWIASATAFAAPKSNKKPTPPVSPADLSDTQLLNTAKTELDAPAAAGKIAPLNSPDTGLVSTAEAIRQEESEIYSVSEMEIGAQSYKPAGMKNKSAIDTYTLSGVAARPMLLVNGRKWFLRDGLRSSLPWRAGFGAGVGFTSNTVSLKTSLGKSYDNVRLNSLLLAAGPEGEIFYRKFALGLAVKAGKVLFVQATPTPYLNKSEDSNFWEMTGSLRFQPTKAFYGKLAYSRRAGLGSAEGIQVQENSAAAFIGFGM